MKKVMITQLLLLLVLYPIVSHADPYEGYVEISNNYWDFYEPQDYDLSKDEAVDIAWKYLEENYMPLIGDGDILDNCEVSAFYLLSINEDLGEVVRYWRVMFHFDGSPYFFLSFDIDTPTGRIRDTSAFSMVRTFFTRKENLPNVKDIDAVYSVLPIMIQNDLIPSYSEKMQLHHFEIDEVPPQQYIYIWGMTNMRILPVTIFLSDEGNNVIAEECYISIRYNDFNKNWMISLTIADNVSEWILNSPYLVGTPSISSYQVNAYTTSE